ncbi:hypothetical protein A2U01_0050785 [Trifolium medium]|uniref:Uncharacterized protein n=1 Tax=Trifolium medium TaxID=97028 RepID=A0A392R190_9FABA|nr:hypothetical protein [Trifolium medium]
MGDRVEKLEGQMTEVQSTLQMLVQQMKQHSALMGEVTKQLGLKSTNQVNETSEGESSNVESRLAGKKVKLLVFE